MTTAETHDALRHLAIRDFFSLRLAVGAFWALAASSNLETASLGTDATRIASRFARRDSVILGGEGALY